MVVTAMLDDDYWWLMVGLIVGQWLGNGRFILWTMDLLLGEHCFLLGLVRPANRLATAFQQDSPAEHPKIAWQTHLNHYQAHIFHYYHQGWRYIQKKTSKISTDHIRPYIYNQKPSNQSLWKKQPTHDATTILYSPPCWSLSQRTSGAAFFVVAVACPRAWDTLGCS